MQVIPGSLFNHDRSEKSVKVLFRRERNRLNDTDLSGKIILKCVLEK